MFERGTIVPLRVELKPFERIVIGETVLVNSGTRTLIDGDAPILRERETITAETANTPAKRLYLCLQTMYLKNNIPRYRTAYQGFLRELREANPGAASQSMPPTPMLPSARSTRRSRKSGSW